MIIGTLVTLTKLPGFWVHRRERPDLIPVGSMAEFVRRTQSHHAPHESVTRGRAAATVIAEPLFTYGDELTYDGEPVMVLAATDSHVHVAWDSKEPIPRERPAGRTLWRHNLPVPRDELVRQNCLRFFD